MDCLNGRELCLFVFADKNQELGFNREHSPGEGKKNKSALLCSRCAFPTKTNSPQKLSAQLTAPKAPTTSWPAGAGGTPAARVRVLGDANFRCRGEKIPLAGSARVRGVSRLGLRAEAVASS